MIVGVLGNITVIIYTIFFSKEKTATSYLVGVEKQEFAWELTRVEKQQCAWELMRVEKQEFALDTQTVCTSVGSTNVEMLCWVVILLP